MVTVPPAEETSASSATNLQGQAPASNIMALPQLGGMTFSVTNNAGWYDVLYFYQANNPSVPLDLSGMDFHAELRLSVGDGRNCLDLSTTNNPPQFVNGGTTGALFFSVDVTLMAKLTPGVYQMDLLTTDIVSKMIRNLCEVQPIVVTVNEGVTR